MPLTKPLALTDCLPFLQVLEHCKNGAPSCAKKQVAYMPGFGGQANRTSDSWFYICSTAGTCTRNPWIHQGDICDRLFVVIGHWPTSHDSRNHDKLPLV